MRDLKSGASRRAAEVVLVMLVLVSVACIFYIGAEAAVADGRVKAKLQEYATVRLTADLSDLTSSEKEAVRLFIKAAKVMDALFWEQAYGDKEALVAGLPPDLARLVEINYGPWDRLHEDRPLLPEVGPKPEGARFYPEDMTKEEFERCKLADKASLYTYLRRDESHNLITVPYHIAHASKLNQAASYLRKAATLVQDQGLSRYLKLRADALLSDNYRPSDMAWMDMKNNRLELVIGPIETYEDRLFGYKAAYEAYVLLKDMEWSKRLARYVSLLPELQRELPVPEAYKSETPGTDSDLNAYDVLYYAGHCNAGSKTIAINLPNDEQVQLQKGSRRLQLKNAMRAKFERIMLPIASCLIVPEQQDHVTFNAFFSNTMFHEVAHGLGIKKTLHGGTVRKAMREYASVLEEGKADILGLYMVTSLYEKGILKEGDLLDYYTTFLAGIFRSSRFGATSAHGKANMIRFNFFQQRGAFVRDPDTGRYRVKLEAMKRAMEALSAKLLVLQGDGDYGAAAEFVQKLGVIREPLKSDLARLAKQHIPIDVVFEQGIDVLGL